MVLVLDSVSAQDPTTRCLPACVLPIHHGPACCVPQCNSQLKALAFGSAVDQWGCMAGASDSHSHDAVQPHEMDVF